MQLSSTCVRADGLVRIHCCIRRGLHSVSSKRVPILQAPSKLETRTISSFFQFNLSGLSPICVLGALCLGFGISTQRHPAHKYTRWCTDAPSYDKRRLYFLMWSQNTSWIALHAENSADNLNLITTPKKNTSSVQMDDCLKTEVTRSSFGLSKYTECNILIDIAFSALSR